MLVDIIKPFQENLGLVKSLTKRLTMNTSLNKRLKKHPQLEKHMEGLLDLVENQNGEYNYANETESKLIQKMRNFGQDILKKWAECREEKETKQWDKEKEKRRKHGKKKYTGKPPMGR